ncbi:30S ribosomal protein S9 [Staphylococcus epidermidis]
MLELNERFDVRESKGKYDVLVKVEGGGFSGEAEGMGDGIGGGLLEGDGE